MLQRTTSNSSIEQSIAAAKVEVGAEEVSARGDIESKYFIATEEIGRSAIQKDQSNEFEHILTTTTQKFKELIEHDEPTARAGIIQEVDQAFEKIKTEIKRLGSDVAAVDVTRNESPHQADESQCQLDRGVDRFKQKLSALMKNLLSSNDPEDITALFLGFIKNVVLTSMIRKAASNTKNPQSSSDTALITLAAMIAGACVNACLEKCLTNSEMRKRIPEILLRIGTISSTAFPAFFYDVIGKHLKEMKIPYSMIHMLEVSLLEAPIQPACRWVGKMLLDFVEGKMSTSTAVKNTASALISVISNIISCYAWLFLYTVFEENDVSPTTSGVAMAAGMLVITAMLMNVENILSPRFATFINRYLNNNDDPENTRLLSRFPPPNFGAFHSF